MEYLIGSSIAGLVFVFALLSGFDRDRAFYPTVTIVVGHYYILFACMAGSTPALMAESVAACVFLAAAVLGFRKSLWWAAGGLCGHGVFDFFHHSMIQNPGVPVWWPGFCLSFDILAGLLVAWLLVRRGQS